MENTVKIINEFEFESLKYKVVEPTANILREAKYKYTKAFTDAIKQGFYTKKKLELILKEDHADIINAHVSKRAELIKLMSDTQKAIDVSEDPDQVAYFAELMKIYRETLINEDVSMNVLFQSTAETLAEDERVNFLIYSLIRSDSGEMLWNSYEDFLNDGRYYLIEACKYQILCWDYKLDPNWEAKLPEASAIKKVDQLRKKKEQAKQLEESKVKKDIKEKLKVKKSNISKEDKKKQKSKTLPTKPVPPPTELREEAEVKRKPNPEKIQKKAIKTDV